VKFSVHKRDLVAAIDAASSIAPAKHATFGKIHLVTTDDRVSVRGTDEYMMLSTSFRVDVKAEGDIAVHGASLLSIAKSMPNDTVSFERDEKTGRVVISCGRSKFRIDSGAGEDIPRLPSADDDHFVYVDAKLLSDLIGATAWAMCEDESFPHMMGIRLTSGGGSVRATSVSLGAKSMATAWAESDAGALDVTVPPKAVQRVRKILADAIEADEVGIAVQHGCVHFRLHDTTLSVRTVADLFVPFEKMVAMAEGKCTRTANVQREQFSDALHRVRNVADEQASAIDFVFTDGELKLNGSRVGGEGYDVIPIDYAQGRFDSRLNADLVAKAMNATKVESLAIRIPNDALDPVMVVPQPGSFQTLTVFAPLRQ
jgi:DNA polymerase-3 subunit beta